MTRTNLSMSISADGYVAGPDQSEENPLGVGGINIHQWHIGLTPVEVADLAIHPLEVRVQA